MIELIPAIDLIGGKCVRLSQGEFESKKVYDEDPAEVAARFADCGIRRIHLVDLEGAKQAAPANLAVLERIRKLFFQRYPNSDIPFNFRLGMLGKDAFTIGAREEDVQEDLV